MSDASAVKLLGVSGSLRQQSYNSGALRSIASILPEAMTYRIAGIADLPFYSGDVEQGGLPDTVKKLRAEVFVGGTLSLMVRSGVHVEAAWMTSGGYDGLGALREDELRRAMEIAGVTRRHLLRLPDGGLVGALEEACAALHRLVCDVRPVSVIGPAFEGGHADHDATNFAVAEGCRRAGWDVPMFEYPCYAPDVDAPNGLRLSAFPAHAGGVQHVQLDKAALRCKESMATAYASQREVFGLLGWQPSKQESFRRYPRNRDYRTPPHAGFDSYAHWFNWRSTDRFEHLVLAIASVAAAAPLVRGRPTGFSLRT